MLLKKKDKKDKQNINPACACHISVPSIICFIYLFLITWPFGSDELKTCDIFIVVKSLSGRVHGGSFAMQELTSKQKIPAEFVLNTEFKNK
jgi:hypothetical protein